MNVWTQAGTGAWPRDEKLALSQLIVGIIGVLVAIIAVLVTLLIHADQKLDDKQRQFDETNRQTHLLMENQGIAIRDLQTDVRELKAELERVKAAKDAAELRAKQAEERVAVWQIARIENLTSSEISYYISSGGGSWTLYNLRPGESRFHWSKDFDITIKYDYCLNGYQQWEQYTLWNTSKVAGHEPTESERSVAPTSYFRWGNQSQLLFSAKR